MKLAPGDIVTLKSGGPPMTIAKIHDDADTKTILHEMIPLDTQGVRMKQKPIVNARRLVRRNEPCPFCKSGKKFKHCHGAPSSGTIPEVTPFAGHAQEKPGYIALPACEALGPMPVVRA